MLGYITTAEVPPLLVRVYTAAIRKVSGRKYTERAEMTYTTTLRFVALVIVYTTER